MRALWPAIGGIPWERLERDGSVQYPCVAKDRSGEDVLFPERFATPDGRAKLVPVEPVAPAETPDVAYPMVLITGRILEHWHTGVSRRSGVLEALEPEPFVCLGGADLATLGAAAGDRLRVASRRGEILARARFDPGLPAGQRREGGQVWIGVQF